VGDIALLITNLGNRWGECSSSLFSRLTLEKVCLVLSEEEEDVAAPQAIWTLCKRSQFRTPPESDSLFLELLVCSPDTTLTARSAVTFHELSEC
jgi:hypothetical protein